MEHLPRVFQKQKRKKKTNDVIEFHTRFKIEFLVPFTGCRKALGKMPGEVK